MIGVDAAKNMFQYFRNTGDDPVIDLAGMLKDVPSTRELFQQELDAAKKFVETLPVGTHAITSDAVSHGYHTKAESTNWYFAVGGYAVWGKGMADVTRVGGAPSCRLDFDLKVFDRYNWDGGKKVTLFGVTVTDEFMAEFHRQGFAREFKCVGAVTSKHAWGRTRRRRRCRASGQPPRRHRPRRRR